MKTSYQVCVEALHFTLACWEGWGRVLDPGLEVCDRLPILEELWQRLQQSHRLPQEGWEMLPWDCGPGVFRDLMTLRPCFFLVWRSFLLLEQLEPLSTIGISDQKEASLFIYVCTSSPPEEKQQREQRTEKLAHLSLFLSALLS